MKLDELKPGDEIVVSDYRGDYSIVTVTKITKTQITAGGERYNKADGIMIGHGYYSNPYARNRSQIVQGRVDGASHCISAEDGRQTIAEQKAHRHKQNAARIIKDTRFDVFGKMTVEEVDRIVALIDEAKGR